MTRDLQLTDSRSLQTSNAEEIAITTEQIIQCTNQQQDEIDELKNLDSAMVSLSRTNAKRKELSNQVRRRMMRLESELR